MTRVLFFIQNGVGGAERMTVNIANLLSRHQFNIAFCKVDIPCSAQNGRIDTFIPSDAKIVNVSWSSQIGILRQFYRILKQEQPDIVFSSVMPYNQRLLFLRPIFKNVKFIVRNDNNLFTLSFIKKFALKITYKNADVIVAQTEEMKSELTNIGLKSSKIVVLHNFIDEKFILDKSKALSPFSLNRAVRFVSVGRIATQKGFDILIQAFSLVKKHIPDAELYIVGDKCGVHKEEYERLINLSLKLGVNDSVIFTGYTDNPYRYIKNSDAFVLSSRYEGLPNVLIEAQYLGIPSAVTKCIPMIGRMIKDGENGYLADTENPSSLAKAMIKAIGIKKIKPYYKPSFKEQFIQLFS